MNTVFSGKSNAPTLGQVWKDYRRNRTLKPTTIITYNHSIKCVSDWLNTPIDQISRTDCLERHRQVTIQSGKSMGNYVLMIVSTLMNFAAAYYEDKHGKPVITHNPVSKLTAVKAWNPEPPNVENFIRSADLQKWFDGIHKISNTRMADLYQLIIFTGMRLSEARTLKWTDLDLVNGFINLAYTKNGKPLILPISKYALDILRNRLVDRRTSEPFVFQGTRNDIPMNYGGQHKTIGLKISVPFTPHGLRRTYAVTAAALKIERPIIKRLLNHSDSEVTSIYAIYEPETLRESVEQIGAELCRLSQINCTVSITQIEKEYKLLLYADSTIS